MTAGMSRPVSLFSPGLPWWILMASVILFLDTWSYLSNILASFGLHLWPVLSRCSPIAVLGCRPAVCFLYLVPRLLLVFPMYILSQLSHLSWYTTPDCGSMGVLSFGFASISLSLFVDLWYVDTPCFLKIYWSCSDRPCMYTSNWCHMIQKGHVTPTVTSCHPLMQAERFCQKFGNFSTIIWLCVQNVSSEFMFPESKNIHSQINISAFFNGMIFSVLIITKGILHLAINNNTWLFFLNWIYSLGI